MPANLDLMHIMAALPSSIPRYLLWLQLTVVAISKGSIRKLTDLRQSSRKRFLKVGVRNNAISVYDHIQVTGFKNRYLSETDRGNSPYYKSVSHHKDFESVRRTM